MKISLNISDNAVQFPINPPNTFKLVVEFMHGDADAYTKTSGLFTLEQKAYLEDICVLLTVIGRHSDNNGDVPSRKEIVKLCEQELPHLSVEETENIIEEVRDMIPSDVTCEDRRAAVDGFSVTYFNQDSVEMKVEMNEVS